MTRGLLPVLIGAFGVVVAAVVFALGWPLPLAERCSGDVCETRAAVDWNRVDWSLTPSRLACGEVNPVPRAKLIGPGDVCVVSNGAGQELRRETYEEMRHRWAVRRRLILAGSTVAVVGAVGIAVFVHRRLRVRRP